MTNRVESIPGQLMFDDPALTSIEASDPESIATDPALAGPGVTSIELGEPVVDDDASDALEPGSNPPLTVEVIRSRRRKKTAQARLIGSTVEVRIPDRCSVSEERELVARFTEKFERSRSARLIDLDWRAKDLAARFGLPEPSSIRWVSNQRFRWGSCTPADGTIRLSDRLVEFPKWVIDYVLIHELAHLVVADHSAAFWALVEPYPLAERARGFLIAKGLEGDEG